MKADPSLVSLGKCIVSLSFVGNQLCLYCIVNTALITTLLSSQDKTRCPYWISCAGNPFLSLSKPLRYTIHICKCNCLWERHAKNRDEQCEMNWKETTLVLLIFLLWTLRSKQFTRIRQPRVDNFLKAQLSHYKYPFFRTFSTERTLIMQAINEWAVMNEDTWHHLLASTHI